VVEGLGAHGCEYMTGGRVVVLGSVGWNLAAGMSGGELFVWDRDGSAAKALNGDLAGFADMDDDAAERLRDLVEAHHAATASPLARRLLADWPAALAQFVRITPLTEIVSKPQRLKTSA
jgi:glutamate synthase (NADPH/NADH) large chain